MESIKIFPRLLKNEKTSIYLIVIGISLLVIAIVLFLWKNWTINFTTQIQYEKFGQFGDFVGGVVGSFWALAGVILFYIALIEQRKDFKTNQDAFNLQVSALNNQIDEFRLQRKELENSRRIYEEQSKTMHLQQFESNFYSLLTVYLGIKNTLNNLDANKDYFKSRYDQVKLEFTEGTELIKHNKSMTERYMTMYNENRSNLSHYFKTFYRLVRIIDSNIRLTENEKMLYAKILRSQLTDYEQLLLYYNSQSIYGANSRPLITKYNLLKHIPLFCKPEFNYIYVLQNNIDIIKFSEYLNQFIVKHIKASYDLDSENTKIEEKTDILNCIIGIYFNDEIEIKVYCDLDLTKNNLRLNEFQFKNYLHDLLFDKLVFSTYMETKNVTFNKYITTTETNKIFGITIKTDVKFELSEDVN